MVEEANRHRGRPVAAHAQGTQGIKNALRGGVSSIEHGYLVDNEGIDLLLEKGTFLVPTLSTFHVEGGQYAPGALDKKRRLAETAMERLAEAVRQGVKVALGTDSGVVPHGRNLRELGHLVELGMPALAAIRAGTLHAAQLLRLDESLGTIEPGKIADLVVCDGNPVADVGLLGEPDNVVLVVQGGSIIKDRLPAAPSIRPDR